MLMPLDFEALIAKVTTIKTVEESYEAVATALADYLRENEHDQVAILMLADDLEKTAARLAKAIATT
jgi:Arc/MetJ family transcription regulator